MISRSNTRSVYIAAVAGMLAWAAQPHPANGQNAARSGNGGAQVWRSQDLLDAIGVNSHLAYVAPSYPYFDETREIAALRQVGFTTVRENLPDYADVNDPRMPRFITLLQTGIKISFVTGGNLQQDQLDLDYFVKRGFGSRIIAWEGLNEPDIILGDGYTYAYKDLKGAPAVAQYQIDLYKIAKADPLLKNIPIWEFSLNSAPFNQISYEQVYAAHPAVLNAFDAVNISAYGQTWAPGWVSHAALGWPYDIGSHGGDPLTFFNGPYAATLIQTPEVVKETGEFSTPSGGNFDGTSYLDYAVQAKIEPSELFDTFVFGASRSFIYELADLNPDSLTKPTNLQYHWGLFDNHWNPKLVALVLRNILAALHDGGATATSFATAPLTVTVPAFPLAAPGTVHSGATLVTQNSAGTYRILVWYEPLLWDTAAGKAKPIPAPQPIMLKLSRTCGKTSVYDPYTAATVPGPGNADAIPVMLPDHLVIVTCADPA